ncbi:MAG: Uncharacterized protein G01um10147_311 [Microgenomates group bacterium Gr01-1014_7]|nr:MAG: Uncharacterized protein G01um10147_311 [Microgenomates group bacterium Gr01-1014_7]
MDFYHDLITQESWQVLQSLRSKFNFILIGGWAVFLYTHALKSKDIDLVLDYKDLEKVKKEFTLTKNDRLKKYEARNEEIQIDIYVPFYSNPGLPAEDLKQFVANIEGFSSIEKEVLALLKQKALIERAHSSKGRKDLIDLVSLFMLDDFDFAKYRKIASGYKLAEYMKKTHDLLKTTSSLMELDLNEHKMARLKKSILPKLL